MNSWAVSACYPRRTFYPLSDGPSIQNHRITMPYFRTCLTCWSRSQLGLCHCTRRRISKPPEPSFGRLRYSLGGDRPSQTTRLPMSFLRIYGGKLESQNAQGGSSPLTPPNPKTRVQSLPPILRRAPHNSLIEYSKGARGLSVLWRASGVFTGTTNSPGKLSRQSSDHYAIRAGRNLPDKEFRYLRTVIVTAAVHWGFSSKLHRPLSLRRLTSPFNLPAPGRRQPLYVVFDFAETCVFVKQLPDAIR